MDGLSSSLAVLTAMITPAVLISASGTMILSSSTRLDGSSIAPARFQIGYRKFPAAIRTRSF